jgi:hypothetical protein
VTSRELPSPVPFPDLALGTPIVAIGNLRPLLRSDERPAFFFNDGGTDFTGSQPVPLSGRVRGIFYLWNSGNGSISGPTEIEVLLNGQRLDVVSRDLALEPRRTAAFTFDFKQRYQENINRDGALPDGNHSIRVIIDPKNSVAEGRETDNSYEYVFSVTDSVILPPAKRAPAPVQFAAQTSEGISKFKQLLQVVAPTLSEDGQINYTAQVLEALDTPYYLLTGRTLQQERQEYGLVISIDTRAQWLATNEQVCVLRHESTPPDRYATELAACYKSAVPNSGHFQSPREGRPPTIHYRGEYTPRYVVRGLMHEMGHFRHWVLQRDTPSERTASHKAMAELLAQAFEAAGVRLLEELTGYNLTAFDEITYWRHVDSNFDEVVSKHETGEEHNRGFLAAWGAVLNDPALATLRYKLTTFNSLDSAGNLDLYSYMVAIPWQTWAQRIDGYVANQTSTISTAKGLVRKRLAYSLPPDERPSFDFSKSAFSLP